MFKSLTLVYAMLAMAWLTGCNNSADSTGAGDTGSAGGDASQTGDDTATSDPIKVGVYLSLTGKMATFGTTTRDGMLIAVDEINEAGGVEGRPIELKIYDVKGTTQEVGSAVTRLITRDEVVAVLGEVASTLSLAAGPICQQYGVPMISPSSTNPKVTEVGDMVFRVCFIDPDQGFASAKFSVDELSATTAAVLYDQTQAYSAGLSDAFQTAFKDLGGDIVSVQAYSGGNPDFSAQLTTIRDAKPDVVFIPGYYNDVPNIAMQARRLGIEVPLMGGDGWETSNLAEMAQGALEGCYYSNHYAPEDQRPESQQFVATYNELHGQAPSALSALGYDTVHLLADAITRAGSTDGPTLRDAIASTQNFIGVTGNISINAQRNAVKPMVIIQIKDGKPKYVTTINPPDRSGAGA